LAIAKKLVNDHKMIEKKTALVPAWWLRCF